MLRRLNTARRGKRVPELPEVETTRRGIAPMLEGRRITALTLRRADLRWPIPDAIRQQLPGQRIDSVRRRAKYLLLQTTAGSALLHLGMSGSLRVTHAGTPPGPHDHVDMHLENGRVLRLTDPRRFGCLLWQPSGQRHVLLDGLGPEPLTPDFDGDHLWRRAQGRRAAVKSFLMDQSVVVGVGNIYACEALFTAGIHPLRAANRVSRRRYQRLAGAVTGVLTRAIESGGTTLRDYNSPDGTPGYFERALQVYGHADEPCPHCQRTIRCRSIGQRSSFYCPGCQH